MNCPFGLMKVEKMLMNVIYLHKITQDFKAKSLKFSTKSRSKRQILALFKAES